MGEVCLYRKKKIISLVTIATSDLLDGKQVFPPLMKHPRVINISGFPSDLWAQEPLCPNKGEGKKENITNLNCLRIKRTLKSFFKLFLMFLYLWQNWSAFVKIYISSVDLSLSRPHPVFVCVHVPLPAIKEDNLVELVLSLHFYVESEDWTMFARHGQQVSLSPEHLASPQRIVSLPLHMLR